MNYETLFHTITQDSRYQSNLDWGKPRPGHPEGTVRAHLIELEENLYRLRSHLSEEAYWKLKVLVHVHDTFKKDASKGVAIEDPRSHASLARRFLEEDWIQTFCLWSNITTSPTRFTVSIRSKVDSTAPG